jgi:hypothetical protein
MPFTIALPKNSGVSALRLARDIEKALERSRFTAHLEPKMLGGRNYGEGIIVRPVRLREAKPYCGQHPGECQVPFGGPRPKRSYRYLEWDDWVEFNNLLNDIMDRLHVQADAWSCPPETLDKGSKMWIRRIALGRRHRYEWEPEYRASFGGREVRVWNHGSDDQFEEV